MRKNNIEISEESPFIRARILKVNEQDFERSEVRAWSTREEEIDARLRNRGVNLTYRDKLGPAEKIIAGKSYDEMKAQPAEISVEEGYAQRVHLKIGDQVKFDVQGVEIPAQVVSLREVNWDSFQPNFFME